MAEALSPALPDDIEQLAEQVLKDACKRDLKLATAESCTGGLLASLLTDVPGCSHSFERGFVTYTNDAKHELLGVDAELLNGEAEAGAGPVSETAARQMAEGAIRESRADLAVSITGFAEKGQAACEEAGWVFIGCARRGGETLLEEKRLGDIGRAAFRLECLRTALLMLDRQLQAGA